MNNLSRNPITVFVSVSIIKLGEGEGVSGGGGYISLFDRLCREGTVEVLLGNHIHINPLSVMTTMRVRGYEDTGKCGGPSVQKRQILKE